MTTRPRHLRCSVCGCDAGHYHQHPNRDTGWGICRRCADWVQSPERGEYAYDQEEMVRYYGIAGVHYKAHTHLLHGRIFKVLAEFPESDVGRANAYMEAHPGASVLEVVSGRVILSDKADMGVEA